MKKIAVFIFCTIFSLQLIWSQKVDLLSLSYTLNPSVGLLNPERPMLEDLDLNVNEINAKVFFPIQLKNGKTTIINAIEYDYVNTFFDKFPEDIAFRANLHSIVYTLGVNQRLGDKWGISVIAKPTIASNLNKGISSDDLSVQGITAFERIINESFRIGFGGAYVNNFGEAKFIPIFKIKYHNENLDLNVTAPLNVSAKYRLDKFLVGLQSGVEGNNYNIKLGDDNGAFGNVVDVIKFSRYNIGPVFGWNVDNQSRIEFSAGISLNRVFKLVDVENEESDFDLENGIFFKTGFYFGR